MAYPISIPDLTFAESIDLIVASEASILQDLNQILCNDFVTPILADTITSGADRLSLMTQVLNSVSCKECSMAKVVNSLSSLIVVDKNIATGVNESETGSNCSACGK
ncbi:MAG: hypothetical protein ACRC30_09195 [Clostridium sp.]